MTDACRRFEFDLRVVRLTAIKKAAYRFTDSFVVDIRVASEQSVVVTLTPKMPAKPSVLSIDQFPNEVLDQELREVVAEETEPVRNILLAQAFSNMSVVEPIGEHADFRDDPLKIAVAGFQRDGQS